MRFISILIFSLGLSQCVNANESINGIWQFPGTSVYIEILENGDTFQCRVAIGNSVMTAKGKLAFGPPTLINWEPLKTIDESGMEVSSDGFSWGTDLINLKNNQLTLTGPYGASTYEKLCDELPKECL